MIAPARAGYFETHVDSPRLGRSAWIGFMLSYNLLMVKTYIPSTADP